MSINPEHMGLNAIRQAIEERDQMESKYHALATEMVYEGNSVAWWHSKAIAYRNSIDAVWSELRAVGIAADGKKTCADGVRELGRLRAENARLTAWLQYIEGGDTPCTDESQLRRWAYEAATLGHPAP